MPEKKHLHIISHTHWDREWYMPFEAHRYHLVELFDKLLDTLDNDPSFKSFHLDGQSIVVEDYLEIRPEMRPKIEKYIAEGRLVCGPWYILQDEYLVDGESNVRNMLVGKQVAAEYGKVSDIGYFPDAFGNIGQAPQILRGFGIDCVAFGRGVSECHGDMYDTGEPNYGKAHSEIIWRSPDGSEVNGAVFLNWYNNANEIPEDTDEAARRVSAIRDNAARVASTPHLLFMNGCDHQPVQCNIGKIAENLNNAGFPDEVIHSNFRDYFDAILPYRDNFGIFVGELEGQHSEGWWTLANTASSRIYLKQYNSLCQNLLEKKAEPLSVAAFMKADMPADRDYFRYLWKTLLKNHPHDSICGCSVDDVHSEMVTRFKKVLSAGETLANEERAVFTASLDTEKLGYPYITTVFNPHGSASSEAVSVNLDLPADTAVTASDISVHDGDRVIPADIEDKGIVWDYILPKDAFRVPFSTHRFVLTFRAEKVPALGWKSFGISLTDAEAHGDLVAYSRGMANDRIRVKFKTDGSAVVKDKVTGEVYITGIMVDSGDIGNEYVYHETDDHIRATTEGTYAKVEKIYESAASVTFKATHLMKIPSSADRFTKLRTGECELVIENYFTLRQGERRLDIKTVIHNNAENHRVVVLTKNRIQTDFVLAEGQFDMVKREIKPDDNWKNPTKPGRMTNFVGLEDSENGVLMAGRGLCEYEILRDGGNTVSLTLHRGVHEMGDWLYFPTKDSQCKGELTVEYSLIPYSTKKRGDRDSALNEAYSFAAYAPSAVCAPAHEGRNPASGALVGIDAKNITVSAFKMCDFRDTVILRVFNPGETDAKMKLDIGSFGCFTSVYEANLNEDRGKRITVRYGKCTVPVPAKKIVTVELVK